MTAWVVSRSAASQASPWRPPATSDASSEITLEQLQRQGFDEEWDEDEAVSCEWYTYVLLDGTLMNYGIQGDLEREAMSTYVQHHPGGDSSSYMARGGLGMTRWSRGAVNARALSSLISPAVVLTLALSRLSPPWGGS